MVINDVVCVQYLPRSATFPEPLQATRPRTARMSPDVPAPQNLRCGATTCLSIIEMWQRGQRVEGGLSKNEFKSVKGLKSCSCVTHADALLL